MSSISTFIDRVVASTGVIAQPNPLSANKIRKDLLVGIEAHLWATKDGKKYIDKEINTGRSDGGLFKAYNKWSQEGYLRLGRALEYIGPS